MPALHLMTINAQLMPWAIEALAQGKTNDSERRARRIADELLARPDSQQPDVIAFNEVFDEDGREELLRALRPVWGYVIEKVSPTISLEDSGLMLFSKTPLLDLVTGGKVHQAYFEHSAGFDSLAPKGVAVVRVGIPNLSATIAFTHMQASYDSDDQHRDVRIKQFATILDALTAVLGPTTHGGWGGAVLTGDLNVRGDPGRTSDEYVHVFESNGSPLFDPKRDGPLRDGWTPFMQPPGATGPTDPGFTNIDFETGVRKRLDYVCVSRERFGSRSLVPHHMFVRMKNRSDHFALEAILQQPSPNCTPSEALDISAIAPLVGGDETNPTSLRIAPVAFAHDGSRQWLYLRDPGTYTIFTTEGLEIESYGQTDLGAPLPAVETVDSQMVDARFLLYLKRYEAGTTGETFATREPTLVAARTESGLPGKGVVFVLEHRGESATSAIWLNAPHREVESSWPIGNILGSDDRCWFKASLPLAFSGAPRTEEFVVAGPGGEIVVSILDVDEQPIATASGSGSELSATLETSGGDVVYIVLQRDDLQVNGHTVKWVSPLCYLLLNEPLGLFVNDESGIDAFGSDEPELEIHVDDDPFPLFIGQWDDANTGDRWPDLDLAIKARAAQRLPGSDRVGFVSGITLSYLEPDFNAQGMQVALLSKLSVSDLDPSPRLVTMNVPDAVSDGTYTFYCTLSLMPT